MDSPHKWSAMQKALHCVIMSSVSLQQLSLWRPSYCGGYHGLISRQRYYIERKLLYIDLNFVCRGSLYNQPALFHVVKWCRRDIKPLHGPMLTLCINTYMRILAPVVTLRCIGCCCSNGKSWDHIYIHCLAPCVVLFSGAKSTSVVILLTNALGENRQFSLQIITMTS